ncbi:hypothetical protein [Erwinia amylovora]
MVKTLTVVLPFPLLLLLAGCCLLYTSRCVYETGTDGNTDQHGQ